MKFIVPLMVIIIKRYILLALILSIQCGNYASRIQSSYKMHTNIYMYDLILYLLIYMYDFV